MARTDKPPRRGGFLANVLGMDEVPADDAAESEETAARAEAEGELPSVSAVAAGSSAAQPADVLTADFAALYAARSVLGDANTDSFLDIYATDCAPLEEKSRLPTVKVALKGMRAGDGSKIRESLDARMKLLAYLAQEQESARQERSRARTENLAKDQGDTEKTIAELTRQIEELRAGLTGRKARASREEADERAALDAFVKRVNDEQARLRGPYDFLATIPTTSKKK